MLFVVEPFALRRWLLAQSKLKPEATFKAVEWLHRILLFISLVTVLGAVMGSHGLLFFSDHLQDMMLHILDRRSY